MINNQCPSHCSSISSQEWWNTDDLYLGLEHVVAIEFGSDPLEDLGVADVGALDVAVDGHAVVVDHLLAQDHAPVHLTIVTRNRSDFRV